MAFFENPFSPTAGAKFEPVPNQPGNPSPPQIAPAVPRDIKDANLGEGGSGVQPKLDDKGNVIPDNNLQNADPMLADLNKLWDTELNSDGTPKTPPGPESFLPVLDQKKLGEVVNQMNFTKSIKPEQLADIQAGGEKAAQAMVAILNASGREIAATMFTAAHKMIENGLGNAETRFLGKVPDHVSGIIVNNSLQEHPLMQNSMFAPVVESIRQQVASKFPKASPSQQETYVIRYFSEMMTQGTKKPEPTVDINKGVKTGDSKADWTDWFKDAITS